MNSDENVVVNTTAESVNSAALLTHTGSDAVEHVGPVLDGELIDDTLPQPRRRTIRRRFVRWWQHSPRVPLWLKSKPQAVQAAKDAVVAALRAPWRYLDAVIRGGWSESGGGGSGFAWPTTARQPRNRRNWPTSSRRFVNSPCSVGK